MSFIQNLFARWANTDAIDSPPTLDVEVDKKYQLSAEQAPPHEQAPPLLEESLWTYGVKGSDCYTEEAVGSPLLTLFTQLVRSVDCSVAVRKALEDNLVDTVVLAFQTRDIRGGKGERELFRSMMKTILRTYPNLADKLVPLIPEYGRWDDVWALLGGSLPCSAEVARAIDNTVLTQFQLDQESAHPSLLVKWLPREGCKGSKGSELATHFANLLFPLTSPENGQRLRVYRKTLANLNRILETAEVKMCGKQWATITPSAVPGQLMKRNKHSFFNKKAVRSGRRAVKYVDGPPIQDRLVCAENFRRFVEDVKSGKCVVNGGQTTMPNEHVKSILQSPFDTELDSIIQGQWDAIRQETLKSGGLGKAVFLCDFSGSMDGVPKEVSLALGILGSEIAAPAFKDHILTFDSTPKWHSFVGLNGLREKIESVGFLGQGTSTNFQAACELVLKRLIEHVVTPADAPTHLIVITDMGFDAASGGDYDYVYMKKTSNWQTHFQMIRESFHCHGYEPPIIVCWNVSASYKDAHATAHEVGVVQLSGWSPSVFKAIQTEGVKVKTPYEGLRKLLDAPRYDAVRVALTEWAHIKEA
jgi:hypothetical protein